MASAEVARILDAGIVAIVRLDSASHLMAAAEAISDGGITAIEFTMTTPGALDALREARASRGLGLLLGAGTILDGETARAAILAGAQFIVSPTYSPQVVAVCRRYGVAVIPGALTPTEILTAWEGGADLIKVFPAGSLGPQYLKDIRGPLPQVQLVPTGGVDLDNVGDFIRAGASAVAVGSSLVSRAMVEQGDLSAIRVRAAAFCSAVRDARTLARPMHLAESDRQTPTTPAGGSQA